MMSIKLKVVVWVGIYGPAALAAPGSLLKMQNLRPHPTPAVLEFAF